jgi:hypothetical protein
MTWCKFDDRYPTNRKIRPLSDAAFRLDVSGICWASENTTDGHIPPDDLDTVSDVKRPTIAAAELVRRGRWHAAGHTCTTCQPIEAGWIIHDYLSYNPTAAKVQHERDAKAERQRRWLESKKGATRDGSGDGSKGASDGTSVDASRDGGEAPVDNSATGTTRDNGQVTVTKPRPGRKDEPRANPQVTGTPDTPRDASITHAPSPSPSPTTGGARDAPRPPRRCPRHLDNPDPPPCGPCAEARKTADAWRPPRPVTPADRPAAEALAGVPEFDPNGTNAAGRAALRAAMSTRETA